MTLIKNAALMAFVLGLGLIVGMSSFKMIKNANGTVDPVTYHITSDDGNGNFNVTTSGRCDEGNSDCQFTTTLTPTGGKISKQALADAEVEILKGAYLVN